MATTKRKPIVVKFDKSVAKFDDERGYDINAGIETRTATVDINLARKVLKLVDKGLTSGIGSPKPGQMCVEAAVCYALGEDHGDRPVCVGSSVADAKINLNDASWPSKAERARGLRRVAVAQLGSHLCSEAAFDKELQRQFVTRLVIPALVIAAKSPDNDAERRKQIKRVLACVRKGEYQNAYEETDDAWWLPTCAAELLGNGCDTDCAVVLALHLGEHVANHVHWFNVIADCIYKALVKVKSPGVKWVKELGL